MQGRQHYSRIMPPLDGQGSEPTYGASSDSKPSGLISFLHRRQASSGKMAPSNPPRAQQHGFVQDGALVAGGFAARAPTALTELPQNQQESGPRSPRKAKNELGLASPVRAVFDDLSAPNEDLSPARSHWSRDSSPQKLKKTKSGTNLVSLLSRPKSFRNLHKLAAEDEVRAAKDKENRTPDDSGSAASLPPIFAQFTSNEPSRPQPPRSSISQDDIPSAVVQNMPPARNLFTLRPDLKATLSRKAFGSPERPSGKTHRGNRFAALTHGRSKSTPTAPGGNLGPQFLHPNDINNQLEDLLDRRNIPENQRYKMRNLSDIIKMEFIRQDWAEMQAARQERSEARDKAERANRRLSTTVAASECEEEKSRRGRGRSFTFSRAKKESRSPSKKPKGEGTLGRHFKSKSAESVASERSPSPGPSPGMGLLSKFKAQQSPGEYVAYLRRVQKPELVEVGRLHKLRLLLRNETVAWIEDFIQQGGLREIVQLLGRIMQVEWREEHEDALLHENLLCLKALSTTARAMEYLHSVQADLFPKLLHLLFDPEKKGPSEFTTRNIVTSVLLTYIKSAAPAERISRAETVLAHLRDKEPKEDERPLPFVLEMRRERPYRIWCKEVVNVTKEVFWIFLHNMNVVALTAERRPVKSGASGDIDDGIRIKNSSNNGGHNGNGDGANDADGPYGYMLRHFPPEHPPVPAAPYVGGVEWDATNYLASHLDLMNAIVACTPEREARNRLREQFRISGWERCLGGSLRLCKEKFYGFVHTALRTWVAAAAEDGWDVKDVRFGPRPDTRSSPRRGAGAGRKAEAAKEAPQLAIPRLELAWEKAPATREPAKNG